MRFRTIEIRWHDSKPITTCDFQPVSFKKARPAQDKGYAGQSWRLATGGEDNHVRLWMVHPNILPPSVVEESVSHSSTETPTPRQPRVEYLATLSRHSAAVNVVRFSPNGELIASAGDDGMIIIWAPSSTPQTSTYGSDLSPDDLQYEKEHWKPRTTFRCTTMQVYDLAWSPTGEYLITGSTDNVARIFSAHDGKCVNEIAEHSHYVQGVAWDPLNEYVATQSSDRSMHVYKISTKHGVFEAHAAGKNNRMSHQHSRTPSRQSRPRNFRRESTASETESVITTASEQYSSTIREEAPLSASASNTQAPLTPATSVASTPSMFPPPPMEKQPSSRRSSFSGSNAPSSPANYARYGRSPSPMPALPAIRPLPAGTWASVKLYGDESFTNFFRRLTFSPDGGLLLTPAGQFEDPSVIPGSSKSLLGLRNDDQPSRGRKNRPSINTGDALESISASSVYIYSRANFARAPIAQLPGHKKASVAVKFSPILYELRRGVIGAEGVQTKSVILDKDASGEVAVDISEPPMTHAPSYESNTLLSSESVVSPRRPPSTTPSSTPLFTPAPLLAANGFMTPGASSMRASPALSPVDSLRPPTPAASKPSSPMPGTGSVFALPYRMFFAVVTMDSVAIYDTQQAGPVCLLTKLHYDEFTDLTWSPDGQCLMVASRDGYCTMVIFDEILPAYHTQQHTLQLQSIAQQHSVPLTVTPSSTPASSHIALPSISSSVVPQKRTEPPFTPATSQEGLLTPSTGADQTPSSSKSNDLSSVAGSKDKTQSAEPPKKKRRVALTRVADIE